MQSVPPKNAPSPPHHAQNQKLRVLGAPQHRSLKRKGNMVRYHHEAQKHGMEFPQHFHGFGFANTLNEYQM
jgi:hypothetical protein